MNQLSLATHFRLHKNSQLQHLCFFATRLYPFNGFYEGWANNIPWEEVLGLILDKLDSKEIYSQRRIFRLCSPTKCNRQLYLNTCTSLDLWCWGYSLEKLQKGLWLLWYLIEILAKKVHPQPYTLTMIFSDVVLEHMLSETNTDRTVATQTKSTFKWSASSLGSTMPALHPQHLNLVKGNSWRTALVEQLNKTTSPIDTVEHPKLPTWNKWKWCRTRRLTSQKINLSVETNMFLKKEHPPTKWWTVNSLIENQDPLAKSQKSPSENLRINPQKLVDS